MHILSCLAGNAELIVVPDQPAQPLQTPEEDALLFPQQLIHQKRIVCSACGPVFGGQHDLAAKETVGLVVQGGQRTVAEAEKADIELTLIALNTLALHIHLALGGHDGFDMRGVGRGPYTHIYHQQHDDFPKPKRLNRLLSTFWMLVVFMLSPSSERMTSPMRLLPSPPLPMSMSIFCPLVVGSRQ